MDQIKLSLRILPQNFWQVGLKSDQWNLNRIVVEARKCGYLLDVFVPFEIDQDAVGAEFHRDKQVLTLTMPLLKSMKWWTYERPEEKIVDYD